MIRTVSFCFTFLLAALLSCQSSRHAKGQSQALNQPNMKNTVPEDFSITLTENQGMLPVYSTIFISAKECYFDEYEYMVHRRTSFTLSPEQLERLWQTLQDNAFEHIESEKHNIADRGGVSVFVQHNGKKTKLYDVGSYILKEEWRKQFYEIVTTIKEMTDAAMQEKKVTVKLRIDVSITTTPYVLGVFIRGGVNYNSEKEGKKEVLEMKLLPGEHIISATLQVNTEPAYARKTVAHAMLKFKVEPGETQTFTLKYAGGELVVE
jgi:hypothetical protein